MERFLVGLAVAALGLPLAVRGAGLPGEPFDITDPTPRPVRLGVDIIHSLLTDPADPFVCIDLNDPTAPPLGLGDPPRGPLPYGINVPLGGAENRPACRTAHNVHGFNAPPLLVANDGRVIPAYDPQTGIPQGTIPLDGPGVTFAEEGSHLAALLDGGNLPALWTGTSVVVEASVFQAFISSGAGRDAIPDGHPLNELPWSDLVIAFDVDTGNASLQAQGTICHGIVAPDDDPTSATFGQDVCRGILGPFWMVGESAPPWDFFSTFGDPFGPGAVIIADTGGVLYGDFFAAIPTDRFCTDAPDPTWGPMARCGGVILLPGEAYNVSTNPLVGFTQGVIHAVTANLASGLGVLYDDLGDFALYEVPENEPPDCSGAIVGLGELWPPNHEFREVSVAGVTDPDGDPIIITITEVFQDEHVDSPGSGNTCPDAAGIGTGTALLRSERNGDSNGRVYHLGFRAEEGQGGECTGIISICHPHDQDQAAECVDEGPLYDSTGPCDPGNDADGDGLLDTEEEVVGTHLLAPDSDGDGFDDATELDAGSNPLDAASTPGSGPSGVTSVPTLSPWGLALLVCLLLVGASSRTQRPSR